MLLPDGIRADTAAFDLNSESSLGSVERSSGASAFARLGLLKEVAQRVHAEA